MHPLVSIDDFLREGLAQAVKDAPRNVLFATYNSVRGIEAGAYSPKDNLTIHVQSGYFEPPPLLVVMVSPITVEQMGEAAGIMKGIADGVDANGYGLAFVYVGVSSFDVPLAFAKQLGKQMAVYIVSCDCNLDRNHRPPLVNAIERGEVRGVVITERCGGEVALRRIHDRLVELY